MEETAMISSAGHSHRARGPRRQEPLLLYLQATAAVGFQGSGELGSCSFP